LRNSYNWQEDFNFNNYIYSSNSIIGYNPTLNNITSQLLYIFDYNIPMDCLFKNAYVKFLINRHYNVASVEVNMLSLNLSTYYEKLITSNIIDVFYNNNTTLKQTIFLEDEFIKINVNDVILNNKPIGTNFLIIKLSVEEIYGEPKILMIYKQCPFYETECSSEYCDYLTEYNCEPFLEIECKDW
jgi:hypothetical protein